MRGACARVAVSLMARRRSHLPLVLSGVIVIAAGFAVGAVELLHFPKGSIWVVVAITAAVVAGIRALTRR